jgi:hypothetical protein
MAEMMPLATFNLEAMVRFLPILISFKTLGITPKPRFMHSAPMSLS